MNTLPTTKEYIELQKADCTLKLNESPYSFEISFPWNEKIIFKLDVNSMPEKINTYFENST
jgi:hypothetical protein